MGFKHRKADVISNPRIQLNSENTTAAVKYFVGSETSVFSISDLRIPIWSILATLGLGLLVLLPGGFVYMWVARHISAETSHTMPWLGGYVDHAVMLVIALVLSAWLSKGRLAEYGLRWPQGKSYVLSALVWGTSFGVLMTAVDYFPQILKRIPPPEHLSLTPLSLIGWLGAYGVVVGFTEEIPFRGLLQTFLMRHTSGRIRCGEFDMHVGGVILALLFALAHITSFWQGNVWLAIGQQSYGFVLGIVYAYWREKSGSLLAPILGHNISDGTEYALMFLMTWLWR
ncbi:CPBP family intramembrane glutamic endopeptidase [Granulicella mallensis]|jgi:membrane protease YdiL (CAAX protease family)|uniref:CAAX prenyl protease 2/Lysostaphin resistance protein A-like domain-containing protein n=1 Tax=Granulicella mallensis TaxID=940614 RepID=A0A7W8E9Z4_9BACT|nr:CPBP family intramembrane glutamic endopeptidase [Granulicella mallensis]MBB5064277.1 hypothetical protein [Granulicella mallensis]